MKKVLWSIFLISSLSNGMENGKKAQVFLGKVTACRAIDCIKYLKKHGASLEELQDPKTGTNALDVMAKKAAQIGSWWQEDGIQCWLTACENGTITDEIFADNQTAKIIHTLYILITTPTQPTEMIHKAYIKRLLTERKRRSSRAKVLNKKDNPAYLQLFDPHAIEEHWYSRIEGAYRKKKKNNC